MLQRHYDTSLDTTDPKKPRGRAVIVANSCFSPDSGLSERDGTEADIQKLRELFTHLAFEVVVHKDRTSEVSNHYILSLSMEFLGYALSR